AKLPYTLAALVTLLALAPDLRVTRLLCVALAASGVLVAAVVLARRSLRDRVDAIARAISARWPALTKDYLVDYDVRSCFDRILSQRRRLWSAFALHLCCWFLGALEVWVAFRLLGTQLSFAQALAIDGTVAGLRTFAFMVPAAAGIQEASYLLAAAVFGIAPPVAIAASFARRARDVLLGTSTLGIAAVGDPQFAVGRT